MHLIILHIMEELDLVFLLLTLNAFLDCFSGFIVKFRCTVYMVLVSSLFTLNALFVWLNTLRGFRVVNVDFDYIVCLVFMSSMLTLNTFLYSFRVFNVEFERIVCIVFVSSMFILSALFLWFFVSSMLTFSAFFVLIVKFQRIVYVVLVSSMLTSNTLFVWY